MAYFTYMSCVIVLCLSLSLSLSPPLSALFLRQVHPLFILSVSDFILAILWMIGGIVWLNPGSDGWANEGSDPHTGMCYVLAIATTVSSTHKLLSRVSPEQYPVVLDLLMQILQADSVVCDKFFPKIILLSMTDEIVYYMCSYSNTIALMQTDNDVKYEYTTGFC